MYDCSTQHVVFAHKFTGKERDSESGLDNFGARYDSSQFGRFMTPDWSAKPMGVPYAQLGDPQSLNLYSYVENNPLSRADPDGHCSLCSWFFNLLTGINDPPPPPPPPPPPGEMEEFTQRPAPASQKSIKLGGKTVKYSLYAAKIGNGKGAVMDAYPQGCDECRWAQTVSRTGSGAMDEQTDVLPIEKGQPIYPTGSPTLNNFSDQPNSQEPGSFTAVTSLGIPDRSAKTFNVLGSMTWGYALDAGGNVITTGPRISSAAEQERSMGVLRRDSPGWTIGP